MVEKSVNTYGPQPPLELKINDNKITVLDEHWFWKDRLFKLQLQHVYAVGLIIETVYVDYCKCLISRP